jgi:hypothetical protein
MLALTVAVIVSANSCLTTVRAISLPRSHVNGRRRCSGSRPMWSISARATASALLPSGGATTIA